MSNSSPRLALSLLLIATTGCGMAGSRTSSGTSSTLLRKVSGSIHGGQQPIAGSNIALYAAGTSGTASAARSLLSQTVTSDSNGNFDLTGLYTCNPGDQVYLVGTGGDAGGGPNSAIALMAALGSCATLQANAATTFISVNEVTTVGSVYALSGFMSSYQNLGSANANALAAAFANVQTMVSIAAGSALQTSTGQGIVPQTTIDSLANSLASCVNSTPSATNCANLFSATTANSVTPTDTIGATLNVALYPTANPSAVYLAATPTPPFQPTLSAAPASYAIVVQHPSDVLQYHNDTYRSGAQTYETTLTPSNVNINTFGKLFTYTVDSYTYAQNLYLGGVGMPDGNVHNLLFSETTHGTVYAFDADSPTTVWTLNYIPSGETYVTTNTVISNCNNPEQSAIVGTPVIDRSTLTMYFVVKSVNTSTTTYYHRLHAISIIDGSERPNSPQIINPTFGGTGAGSSGGVILFDGLHQNQRSALLINTDPTGAKHIWVTYASHCDVGPYHGILLGFDPSSLAVTATYNNTPNGSDGGFWGSNGGPVADAQGNIYNLSGNGTFDANTGGPDYGDSATRLVSPAPGAASTAMTVADYFTPSNQQALSNQDADFGGTEPLLIADPASGVAPLLIVASDKLGDLFLLNASNLGGYDTGTHGTNSLNGDLQEIATGNGFIWNFSFFNNILYISNPLLAYSFVPGTSTTAGSLNPNYIGHQSDHASPPVVSANGTANSIVWVQDIGSNNVRAFLPDLSAVLYDASTAPNSRDTPPPALKFASPVIANGKVYISGSGSLSVYGLLQ